MESRKTPNPFHAELESSQKFIPSLREYIVGRLNPELSPPEVEEALTEMTHLIDRVANLAALGAFLELTNKNVSGYQSLLGLLREGVAVKLLGDILRRAEDHKFDPDSKECQECDQSDVCQQTPDKVPNEALEKEAKEEVERLKRHLGLN